MKTFYFTREQQITELVTVSVQARNEKEALTLALEGEYEEDGDVMCANAGDATFTLMGPRK